MSQTCCNPACAKTVFWTDGKYCCRACRRAARMGTRRNREIVAMRQAGQSNQTIGAAVGLHPDTVSRIFTEWVRTGGAYA